jgi:gas vesicle protein
MKTDKVILGVLGGLAAGALMGILFAPEKGKKTRKKILSKGNDYADDLKDKYENLLGTISKKYEDIWLEGQDLLSEGQNKLEKTKKEIQKLEI